MCGIVGFVDKAETSNRYVQDITSMLSMLKHRGPDEMGYYFDENIALGSARLSIIDITNGTQPIIDDDNGNVIIFNGEIFNYVELRQQLIKKGQTFKTATDTEVILNGYKHWGSDVCKRLNGQFAFCILDKRNNRLFFGRDRFGERPLFYCLTSSGLVFGSEIKALLAHRSASAKFNNKALQQAGHLWTVIPGNTVFEDIKQLKHGCYAEYNLITNSWVEKRYYEISKSIENTNSLEKNIGELRELLEDAVNIRLRSDVEVGAYLSGGIDSTIIAYLAKKLLKKNIHTFSIRFDAQEYDEGVYQNDAVNKLDTLHHTRNITNKDLYSHFEDLVYHAETPQFRTAAVPMFLLSKLVNEIGLKVVLTGEGSDEWFLGYNIFKEIKLRKSLRESQSQKQELKKLFPYIAYFNENNLNALIRFYSSFHNEKHKGLFSHEPRFSNGTFTCNVLSNKNSNPLGDLSEFLTSYNDFEKFSDTELAQILEADTLLSGYLLSTQGDRTASAHGVEGRSAFLDQRIVEFAMSLPEQQRLYNNNNEKYILKEAYKNVIPESIVSRPKQPYRAPDLLPFVENMHQDQLLERISSDAIANLDVFNVSFCKKFINKIYTSDTKQYGQKENQTFIFLYSLLVLAEKFVIDKPGVTTVDHLLKRQIDGRGH